MTTQHTPGPWNTCHMDGWKINFDFKGEGTVETHAVCDANGKIVAFAVDHADSAFADLNTDHADLIAAAPDLLSCLIEMVEVHDEPCHLDHHGCCQSHFLDDVNDGGCRVANARAAIAKATGESNE